MSRIFLAPDDLQKKSLSRRLTVKKGYIQVVQTSDYIEGQWELTSKFPPEARVEDDVRFVGNFSKLKTLFVTQRFTFLTNYFSSLLFYPKETLYILLTMIL